MENAVLDRPKTRRLQGPATAIAHAVISLGALSMWWARNAMGIFWPQNTARLPFWIEDDIGNQVAETRNMLVRKIRESDNDRCVTKKIFWQDDDVCNISPRLLQALAHHDYPIVSGVYFVKGEMGHPLIYPERLGGHCEMRPDECFEAWGCGMGLTLVDMEVYDRMEKELDLGVDCNGNPKWYHTSTKDDPTIEDGAWNLGGTEDLYFCENAAKLGYKPIIDCGKHAFGFHYDLFGDYGPKKMAYPSQQWLEFLATSRTPDPHITWKLKDGKEVVWR